MTKGSCFQSTSPGDLPKLDRGAGTISKAPVASIKSLREASPAQMLASIAVSTGKRFDFGCCRSFKAAVAGSKEVPR